MEQFSNHFGWKIPAVLPLAIHFFISVSGLKLCISDWMKNMTLMKDIWLLAENGNFLECFLTFPKMQQILEWAWKCINCRDGNDFDFDFCTCRDKSQSFLASNHQTRPNKMNGQDWPGKKWWRITLQKHDWLSWYIHCKKLKKGQKVKWATSFHHIIWLLPVMANHAGFLYLAWRPEG